MSQENVEIVRRGFKAFNDGDFNAMMRNFAEDIEWRLIGGFADLVGAEFRGHAGVRRFFDDLMENLGRNRSEMEAILEADDRVVVIVRTRGAGAASGAPATMRWGQVYTFREGQISAVDNYYEASDALAAAGLSEQDAPAGS
jgi:ketosteroid isomerase-like protein